MRSGKLFNALAIRDTNPQTSSSSIKSYAGNGSGEGGNPGGPISNSLLTDKTITYIQTSTEEEVFFEAVNTLNQSVSLQFVGSFDGSTWVNIGSAITVGASTGTTAQTLTDAWPKVRATATCSIAPASGSFTLNWIARRRAGVN